MEKFRYAGFWVRAVADIIDSTLLDVAAVLVGLILLGGYHWIDILIFSRTAGAQLSGQLPGQLPEQISMMEHFSSFFIQVGLVVIRTFLALYYYTWATYRYRTTLGKRLLRIYVVSAKDQAGLSLKQSLIRCLSYTLSYLPLGAGFLMAAFQPEKRALHDLIAQSICIRTDKSN